MGRRSAEEEQNHWPGFVDALSTIVMVVTFLLIILAVVIFVLSQSIARNLIENATANGSTTGGDIPESTTPSDTTPDNKLEDPKERLAETQIDEEAPTDIGQQQSETEPKPKATTTKSEREVADVPEIDGEDLIIRSRRVVDEEERIIVDAPDISKEEQETLVTQSASFLTLSFDPSATKISKEATKRLNTFLGEKKAVLEGRKIAIFSFVDITSGSVSQARRIAYYRALAARNALLENGLLPENITLEIRPSLEPESNDTVRLIVQE